MIVAKKRDGLFQKEKNEDVAVDCGVDDDACRVGCSSNPSPQQPEDHVG